MLIIIPQSAGMGKPVSQVLSLVSDRELISFTVAACDMPVNHMNE
jgi:hypothetical protein